MKGKYITRLLCCAFLWLGVSCSSDAGISSSKADSDALVEVGGYTLYKDDVEDIIPVGLTPEDSISAAEAYIKLWIKDQLVFLKAEENLGKDETIKELVDNYRHSLLVFTYQENLLYERLSKSVTDSELLDYYNERSDQFKLSNNIIRGLFLVVPKSSDQLESFKKWYKNPADFQKIENSYLQNTNVYEYFYDKWISFEEIVDRIPIKVSDASGFIRSSRNIEVEDSTNVYLLHIRDFKLQEEIAPFDYARPKVLDLILSQRKTAYLTKVEDDLYNEALKNKTIKFFKKTEETTK